MKILVIGGSYFYGRVFVMLAAGEHDITVVNRGTYSMEAYGVRQISGDRRTAGVWKKCDEEYDAIVDFCAYEPGDIAYVMEHLAGHTGQYILISTVDVYRRQIGGCKREDAPFEDRKIPGEAGAYIAGKTALEQEIRTVCAERQIAYTVLRPAVLYGPFNYAPREAVYIQLAVQQHVVPRYTDASGSFQFVYVKDAARAVLACIGNTAAYGQAYNICHEEVLDYDKFFQALKQAADVELSEIPMSVHQAEEQGIPIPFPVTEAETELYSNEKSVRELHMDYTDINVGIQKTYRAMRDIYL